VDRKAEAPKAEYFRVDTATAGAVTITFGGAKPARQAISMEAEACRAGLHRLRRA
jgi:hypothetical protein